MKLSAVVAGALPEILRGDAAEAHTLEACETRLAGRLVMLDVVPTRITRSEPGGAQISHSSVSRDDVADVGVISYLTRPVASTSQCAGVALEEAGLTAVAEPVDGPADSLEGAADQHGQEHAGGHEAPVLRTEVVHAGEQGVELVEVPIHFVSSQFFTGIKEHANALITP